MHLAFFSLLGLAGGLLGLAGGQKWQCEMEEELCSRGIGLRLVLC